MRTNKKNDSTFQGLVNMVRASGRNFIPLWYAEAIKPLYFITDSVFCSMYRRGKKPDHSRELILLLGHMVLIIITLTQVLNLETGCDDCCTTADCTDCHICFCGPPGSFVIQPLTLSEQLLRLIDTVRLLQRNCPSEGFPLSLERPPRLLSA